MRGKVRTGTRKMSDRRITPAYAGKSLSSHSALIWFWDHPRLCGEKSSHSIPDTLDTGSPPPMRGKGFNPHLVICDERITPAYAGKSVCSKPDTPCT
mgnify:CR=1 FL=1